METSQMLQLFLDRIAVLRT